MPILTIDNDRDNRKTNIIIKGAFTTKSSSKKKLHQNGGTPLQQSPTLMESFRGKGLMEKLLNEVTSKYKPYLTSN